MHQRFYAAKISGIRKICGDDLNVTTVLSVNRVCESFQTVSTSRNNYKVMASRSWAIGVCRTDTR